MSLPFLSTPPSSTSLTFSRYVRFIFHVSRSCVASHFPTSPVVPIGFLVFCFPFIPPALPVFSFLSLSCPFQFPFVSLSFPVAFLSCRLPISSPHFLALPCISPLLPQYFPQKIAVFPAFSQRGRPKTQSLFRNRAWDPCFATPVPRRLRLVERHQVAARYVGKYPTRRTMSADIFV